MSFRLRLAVFLVASLAILQSVTAVLVYEVTRRQVVAEGKRQLAIAGTTFARQLDDVSTRVSDNVQVLTLDFALRSAIAQRDRDTVRSALRNHGRRIGAARMLLIELDGTIAADTQDVSPDQRKFPYADLVEGALEKPSAALVAWDDQVFWIVVVPVHAPALIGLIAASIPVDEAFLKREQEQSALPKTTELAVQNSNGTWMVVARANPGNGLASQLLGGSSKHSDKPALIEVADREYVALATPLRTSAQSRSIVAVLGYSLDEALQPYRSVALTWAVLLALGLVAGLLGSVLIARGVSRPIEALAATARRIASGDYRPAAPVAQGGEVGERAAALTNMAEAISEREEHIRFQNAHDDTTGLMTRVAAEAAIQQMIDAQAGKGGSLLMIALARLPEITKTLGHAISDRLMRDAAARIRGPAGSSLIARASDSEFLVWMCQAGHDDAVALAFRLLDVLGEPYREADLAIDAAPAVGIALHPLHGIKASALLQRAEVALFAALGADEPVAVYDPGADPHRPERLSLMSELREAIDRRQLQMHYQPKLNLATGVIDGVEGLVRWQHPKLGLIGPDMFIPLAEETGNIRRLTRWVLASCIAQAHAWDMRNRRFRFAINLSARDLDDADLPHRIGELLAIHAVMPRQILLEITESAVMGKPDAAIRVLRQLADLGIDLAIDDFGVGQSSFAYLRRLPVRELKIDKSFLLRLAMGAEDRTIVRSIVELGHRLGYRVTAEGVTDQASLDYLGEIGCDHAQGFFISRALPPDAFDAFLAASPWRRENLIT
jgi:diguanylate cyclase (GGDEF)-like protein